MTEDEWDGCSDPRRMLKFLKGRASERQLRRFACACWGWKWEGPIDDSIHHALDVAERYAGGLALKEELDGVKNALQCSPWLSEASVRRRAATSTIVRVICYGQAYLAAQVSSQASASRVVVGGTPKDIRQAVLREHCGLLRCVVGSPFHVRPHGPYWLTPTVNALATTIYEEQAFDRMPILADALEEAGCGDSTILEHLRGKGPHARGCFCLDLLLQKREERT